MASKDYIESLNNALKNSQKKLLKGQQQELFNIYAQAAKDYSKKFSARAGQSTATKALIREYSTAMAKQLDKLMKEYSVKASQYELHLISQFMSEEFQNQDRVVNYAYKKAIEQITNAAANRSAYRIIQGTIYKDGKGLSERIWNVVNHNAERINEVVAQCMAQQLSAGEMSKVLESFMKPGARTEWDRAKIRKILGPGYASWNKQFSYEALRLARTTITHSAQMATREAVNVNPYADTVRWVSAHAVGRTCEQCKSLDGKVFLTKDLPWDHPNGLCTTEWVFEKSWEEMTKELKDWSNGGTNKRLDSWWKKNGPKTEAGKKVTKGLNDAKKQAKKKPAIELEAERNARLDRELANIREQVGEKHWPFIREKIARSPEFMQEYIKLGQSKYKYLGEDGDNAYFMPSKHGIYQKLKSSADAKKGPYTTFFHEFGHLLDQELDESIFNMDTSVYESSFYKAIVKDYENLLETCKKEAAEARAAGNIDVPSWSIMWDKVEKKYGRNGSSSVQDILGGLSGGKYKASWGHSQKYWKQGGRGILCNETWAHMTEAYTAVGFNPERLEVMQDIFPTATEEYKNLVIKTVEKVKDYI